MAVTLDEVVEKVTSRDITRKFAISSRDASYFRSALAPLFAESEPETEPEGEPETEPEGGSEPETE